MQKAPIWLLDLVGSFFEVLYDCVPCCPICGGLGEEIADCIKRGCVRDMR